MEVGSQIYTMVTFSLGKEALVPIGQEAGRSGTGGKYEKCQAKCPVLAYGENSSDRWPYRWPS